jgi:hypothetical protein
VLNDIVQKKTLKLLHFLILAQQVQLNESLNVIGRKHAGLNAIALFLNMLKLGSSLWKPTHE